MNSRLRPHSDITVFQEFTELSNSLGGELSGPARVAPGSLMLRRSAAIVAPHGVCQRTLTESLCQSSLAAVNMGQGFPSWDAPAFLREAAAAAIGTAQNQYTRAAGHPLLCKAVADWYGSMHGVAVDPELGVVVTEGATGAIFTAMQALLEPGDEVIIIEPSYDCYAPAVALAGGIVRRVSLARPGVSRLGPGASVDDAFGLDEAELLAAVGPRTRAIVVNTPHNPTGKVLSAGELAAVAEAVQRAGRGGSVAARGGCYVVADEVYEQLWLGDAAPPCVALTPGLEGRVVSVGSAGKTLACTGWKVGWAVGPEEVVGAMANVNQWTQFCVAHPLQVAVAEGLGRAALPGFDQHGSFLDSQRATLRENCDALIAGLEAAGMPALRPGAGFFVLADGSRWDHLVPGEYVQQPSPARRVSKSGIMGVPRDWAMCRFLGHHAGVVPIPTSAFYSATTESAAQGLLRFAICKDSSTIQQATANLAKAAAASGLAL